jgi:hypothetical protein
MVMNIWHKNYKLTLSYKAKCKLQSGITIIEQHVNYKLSLNYRAKM